MAEAGETERERRLMGNGKRKINNGGKVSKSAAGRAERAPQEKISLVKLLLFHETSDDCRLRIRESLR